MESSKGPNTDASAKIAENKARIDATINDEAERIRSIIDQSKAEILKRKNDFDLHVLLIMKKTGISKAIATVAAWDEGPFGLELRLAKK